MNHKIILLVLLIFVSLDLYSQVYAENQSRHRFAQLTIGYEFSNSIGGTSLFKNNLDELQSFSLNSRESHRLSLGGTHFWGHADFYFSVYSLATNGGVNWTNDFFSSHSSGFETVFKYYPCRIEHNKIRPFIGTGVVPYSYRQTDKRIEFGRGRNVTKYGFPLIGGFTFNHKIHLINFTAFYNYNNQFDYFINRAESIKVKTPPFYLSLGYKVFFDLSKVLEVDWQNGKTAQLTEELRAEKKLNGFFVGVGPSTAYGIGKSNYNQNNRVYLDENFDAGFILDLSLGYFFSKPEISVNTSWRKYRSAQSAYGAIQNIKRNSFALELSHGFLDYHGFVPFIGPILSYEILKGRESFEGTETFNITEKKISYGIVFGWDIKMTHKEWWHLRTNLRYFPNLKLKINDQEKLSLAGLEFNFIQLIVYPNRLFNRKK